jgi:YgiT-type zinc finger domain-containing protein
MSENLWDCRFCGGLVEEGVGTHQVQHEGQLHVIENVPMGICNQCGEKYFHIKTLETIERILNEKKSPEKILKVPVFIYKEKVA